MSKHLRNAALAAVLVLLGLQAAGGSAQATLVKLSVSGLSRTAHTIVVARVQDSAPRHVAGRGRGTIVTDTRLRVEDVLKGAAPATLTLHLPGGSLGGVREVVEDVLVLTPGARYILFLDAQRRIVGWSEGTLPVVGGAVPALGGLPLRAA
jgi:hypothetical protein